MNIIRKYRKCQKLSVIAGILLAVIITTTQSSLYFLNENNPVSYQLEEDKEDKGQENSLQYFSQDAITVSTVQLNLDKPFQVVFELLLPQDDKPIAKPEPFPLCQDFFKNLFRLTISPNAP
ncbi:MAG: hypothetical protein ACNS60_17235 [Candidatus Cyclobacteriaceae bacterium M2_1C_046]